jgi:hypothetical protein
VVVVEAEATAEAKPVQQIHRLLQPTRPTISTPAADRTAPTMCSRSVMVIPSRLPRRVTVGIVLEVVAGEFFCPRNARIMSDTSVISTGPRRASRMCSRLRGSGPTRSMIDHGKDLQCRSWSRFSGRSQGQHVHEHLTRVSGVRVTDLGRSLSAFARSVWRRRISLSTQSPVSSIGGV